VSDRRLDPVSGDFVDGAAGGFESCDDIENQIAASYCIAAGSWEGDPTLGHRFDELARATNTVENRSRLRDLARAAVQWLFDLGLLERVEISSEEIKPDAVAFQVDYYVPGSEKPRPAGPFLVAVGAG
jgi:phage gp46-like protein